MADYIIEVANCHGGSKDYLLSLISEFERFKGHGMKFQPLKPDRIATSDFEWYPVYEKLYFNSGEWSEIIKEASKSKKIWLDLFDTYGVEILQQNLANISGIKFQASILYNYEVLDELERVDCSDLRLIVNVSAIDLESIKERLTFLTKKLSPKEILLEVGFQSYPTQLEDSGLNKLRILKDNFENRLVFADHIEGQLGDAIRLPLIASLSGADFIEKHVLHSELHTEYDHFSAIDHNRYEKFTELNEQYHNLFNMPFINNKEKEYLSKSIQIPISKKKLLKGQGLNIKNDFSFKRSGKKGLSVSDIEKEICKFHILNTDIAIGEPIKAENFKNAIIGTIIAGRLKSSRLKRKALLKIGDLSSVEQCIKSCLAFKDTHYTILATSDNEEDSELKNYTYSDEVIFHKGDPDDVIQRYLSIADKKNIDVIVRVTADMPFVSSEILDILLKSHFESGADYTGSKQAAVGTSPEIINVQALREVKKYFPNAEYSEYMTWYFQNNSDHFRINLVELPSNLIRDYRLTLDYEEDLKMFNNLQENFDYNNIESSTENIFSFLDNHPEVAKINSHLTLKYKTDKKLIDTLNRATRIV